MQPLSKPNHAFSQMLYVGEVYLWYGSVRTLGVKTMNFNYCDMSDECIMFLASAAVKPTDPDVRSGVKRSRG